jgi:hypothetical protein
VTGQTCVYFQKFISLNNITIVIRNSLYLPVDQGEGLKPSWNLKQLPPGNRYHVDGHIYVTVD